MRNDLVHDHSRIEGWDLKSTAGVAIAKKYVWSFINQGNQLLEVFTALAMDWQEQAGFNVPTDPKDSIYFSGIQQKYGHLVDSFFGHDDSKDQL
ncbi:hypothetical protein D9M71_764940 [compost metagenome]